MYLKFGDGDEPNLCRIDVSSTFIENIFRSGLTLVSSNDIITIKIKIICASRAIQQDDTLIPYTPGIFNSFQKVCD